MVSGEGNTRFLATAAISRALRPLRTRCNALAKIASVQSRSSHTTYSSHRIPAVDSALPLAVHPSPDKYTSTAHFSQDSKDSLELVRRVYAVRDAFRNAVARTSLGQNAKRLPTLSSLCAVVIGQNMPIWEVPQVECEDEGSESDATSFVDQMYEAVPTQSRGWLLSSHALAIVLHTCPHHPTLISILLDEALANRFEHQASELLEALLLVALRPKPNGPAAICHPAHSRFLTEWLGRWLSCGFSALSFTAILIQVLGNVQNTEIWTSKAIDNIMRRLFHLDLTVFVLVLTVLANHILPKPQIRRPSLSKRQTSDDAPSPARYLVQWCDIFLERCCAPHQDPSDCLVSDDLLFSVIEALQLPPSSSADAPMLDLKDSTLSLALVWLSSPLNGGSCAYPGIVEAALRSTSPRPSTFHSLVNHVFSKPKLAEGWRKLDIYVSCLRQCRLAKLEALFWGSVLYVVENLEGKGSLTPDERIEARNYRQEVMDRVDEAESKLFNMPTDEEGKTHHSNSSGKQLPSVGQSPWSKGGWKWEPVIGSWVRRQALESTSPRPIDRKRRKVSFVTPKKQSGGNWPGGGWTRTPIEIQRRIRPRPMKKVPALLASGNFTCLAANAVSQRTVLQPVQRGQADQASDDILDLLA